MQPLSRVKRTTVQKGVLLSIKSRCAIALRQDMSCLAIIQPVKVGHQRTYLGMAQEFWDFANFGYSHVPMMCGKSIHLASMDTFPVGVKSEH